MRWIGSTNEIPNQIRHAQPKPNKKAFKNIGKIVRNFTVDDSKDPQVIIVNVKPKNDTQGIDKNYITPITNPDKQNGNEIGFKNNEFPNNCFTFNENYDYPSKYSSNGNNKNVQYKFPCEDNQNQLPLQFSEENKNKQSPTNELNPNYSSNILPLPRHQREIVDEEVKAIKTNANYLPNQLSPGRFDNICLNQNQEEFNKFSPTKINKGKIIKLYEGNEDSTYSLSPPSKTVKGRLIRNIIDSDNISIPNSNLDKYQEMIPISNETSNSPSLSFTDFAENSCKRNLLNPNDTKYYQNNEEQYKGNAPLNNFI